MPIYEFRCDECGERFEELVELGTESAPCPACGSDATQRLLSPQAPPFHLVKTPKERRKQERKNAQLRERTKARFKAARRRAREQARKARERARKEGA